MNYYGLKSLVGSRKTEVGSIISSHSFFQQADPIRTFVEPTFTKEEFPTERPAVLLISAIGASGKTTVARALSFETRLPILDLAAHKAVGDNTLTGVLTTAYRPEAVSDVLTGIQSGSHGIIIDGLDEGRSKTTEAAFEAFLDDVIVRSKGAESPAIIAFGRGQTLLSTWCYLVDKGADVGLISISPFDLARAREYIDKQVPGRTAGQADNYEKARDAVLERLGAAFNHEGRGDAFLRFIGYPPVLDAIGTLLREEPNYHRIIQTISSAGDTRGGVEVSLLIRVCNLLMEREWSEKALPNFIRDIAKDASSQEAETLKDRLYGFEEQCGRVLARVMNRQFTKQLIADRALNERYETAVRTWCPDHPFLDDTRVRNPVFEAVAVGRCILSEDSDYRDLAFDYAGFHQPTYHVLFIVDALAEQRRIDPRAINLLMQSGAELVGDASEIAFEVDGEAWEETGAQGQSTVRARLILANAGSADGRTFEFDATVDHQKELRFGPYLVNSHVLLPCGVALRASASLASVGENVLSARNVTVDTPDLLIRTDGRDRQKIGSLFVEAESLVGRAAAVSLNGGRLELRCCTHAVEYPLARFVEKVDRPQFDADLREKYLRLRRIMMEFRSHKKGGLAKYRDKIEHERVTRDSGKAVLAALVEEGVLEQDTRFYFVNPERFAKVLGISWLELREHRASPELEAFLRRVRV